MASEEATFKGKVEMERKSPHPAEMVCGGVLYLLILVQIIMSIVVFASQNTEIPTYETDDIGRIIDYSCPDEMVPAVDCCGPLGGVYDTSNCVSLSLCKAMRECDSSCSARRLDDNTTDLTRVDHLRRLAEEEGQASGKRMHARRNAARLLSGQSAVPESLWAFMEEHFYVPKVLFLSLFIVAAVFLFSLSKAATPVIWGVIVLDILMLLAVFVCFLVEFEEICYPAIIFAVVGIVASGLLYKQINTAGKVLTKAMEALKANKRLFMVAFGVKIAWGGYFGIWLASLIRMDFTQQVGNNAETGACELQPGLPIDAFYVVWLMAFYWSMYFFQNINLCVLTVQVGGWYFGEPNSSGFWAKALQWSLTKLAGGNAICAAIMGTTSCLKNLVDNKIRLCIAIVNPIDWIPLCLACAFKTCIQTYTKFGMIGQAFAGGDFCSSAQKTANLLKTRLGEAVLTDFIGSRVMSWITYVLCVGVMFSAFAWAESLHDIGIIAELGMFNLVLMLFMSALIASPFLCMAVIVLLEDFFAGNYLGDARAIFNIVFAALFMGAVSVFIMKFVSLVVVDTMNVIFFCFGVETDNGKKQDRFTELYDTIKTVVGTNPANAGVVVGTTPGTTTLQVQVPDGATPGTVISTAGPTGPVQVTVPPGFSPGMVMQVAVPTQGGNGTAAAAPPVMEPAVAVVGNPVRPEGNEQPV